MSEEEPIHQQEEQEEEEQEQQPEQQQVEQPQPQQQQQPQQQTQQSMNKTKELPHVPAREPPAEGSIVIDFEVCCNCKAHDWCTHHDEAKYTNLFLEIQHAIEAEVPGAYCTYNEKKPSTGAFEVSHKGILIFSKKKSQIFPQVAPLVARVKQFLDDVENKKDTSKYAEIKEKKHNPPRQIKERPNFQTYLKQREEQERLAKEQKELEEQKRLEQEERDRIEQERLAAEEEQRRLEEEEAARIKQEEEALKAQQAEEERLAAEERKRQQEEEEAAFKEAEQAEQQNQEEEKPKEDKPKEEAPVQQ